MTISIDRECNVPSIAVVVRQIIRNYISCICLELQKQKWYISLILSSLISKRLLNFSGKYLFLPSRHSRRSCRIDSKASDNSVIYLYRHHLYISFRWYYCQKFVSDCFKTEIELFQAGSSKTFDFSKQSNLKPIRRPKGVFVFLFRNYLTAEKCWHFSGRIIINNLIIWIFMHVCVCVGVCVYFQGPYSLIYGKW